MDSTSTMNSGAGVCRPASESQGDRYKQVLPTKTLRKEGKYLRLDVKHKTNSSINNRYKGLNYNTARAEGVQIKGGFGKERSFPLKMGGGSSLLEEGTSFLLS